MRRTAVFLALAAPGAAFATCWTQAPTCEAALRHADCSLAEGPWPSLERLTVTGTCVVGGCAADGVTTSTVAGDPPVLRRVDGIESVAVPGTFAPSGDDACHLLTFDHLLVPGHYRYGPLDFDVVGEIPATAAVAWPKDLPFQPDGIRSPAGQDEGQVALDVPVAANGDGTWGDALARLRSKAVDAGFAVMSEDATHLEMAHAGARVEVTVVDDQGGTAVLDLRWDWPAVDPMWFAAADACGPTATLVIAPVLDRPADVRVEASCVRDGVRDGPFTALGPGTAFEQGAYAAGIKVGAWVVIGADGRRAEGSYAAGREDGPWVQYLADRSAAESGTYVAGVRDGLWERYWPDHTPRETATWCAGAPCGERIAWYPRTSPATVDLAAIGYASHPGDLVLPAVPAGQIFEHAYFANGVLDGPYERYLPSSSVEGTFVRIQAPTSTVNPTGSGGRRTRPGRGRSSTRTRTAYGTAPPPSGTTERSPIAANGATVPRSPCGPAPTGSSSGRNSDATPSIRQVAHGEPEERPHLGPRVVHDHAGKVAIRDQRPPV